ncbi:major capsid protein [Clostridium botulinum]|uniref:major capsid protein n=1 Tax=Clostridium botulinum TaxID=1491 RepID=UPI001E59E564|nr:major capsid protein [Clostridium botulinum]MCD3223791.1 hypothetical protein [Clostridium botulinum C/D]MCD3295309.1 hypothetical protein [Clostridium botulinum C/D]
MTKTKLQNMIIPANFTSYTAERAIEKNVFFKSGIVANNKQLESLLRSGGKTIIMPFVKPLSGDSEIPSEDNDMEINGITTSEDIARRQLRVKAFGENQLASLLSGDNVMDRISEGLSDYWANEYTKILLSTTKGIFAACTNKVNDISSLSDNKSLFNVSAAIDTKYILGDAADNIGAVAVNSAVYAYMLKEDQITNIPTSDGKGAIKVYKPLMARVIVDDSLPYDNSTKVASMYMYGGGAFGFVENLSGIIGTEIGRHELKGLGDNFIITRKQFVMHPLGIQWKEPSVSPVSPTNKDLETAKNWQKVKEDKHLYLAEFKFKIK